MARFPAVVHWQAREPMVIPGAFVRVSNRSGAGEPMANRHGRNRPGVEPFRCGEPMANRPVARPQSALRARKPEGA